MVAQNVTSLSELEARLLVSLSAAGKTIFSVEDAEEVLKGQKVNIPRLLHTLSKKRWLERLERGRYLILPFEAGPERRWSEEGYVVASYLVDPHAIAYWSALSYYNYTEQVPITIFVATTSRRKHAEAEILNLRFRFVTLRDYKFFGLTPISFQGKQVNFTDREKTTIDCLDHPEYCGGITEAAKGLVAALHEGQVDLKKMMEYAQRMRNRTIFKRLGYLSEALDLEVGDFREHWRKEISKGYSRLDPSGRARGRYSRRWQLIVNLDLESLTAELAP